MWQVYIIIWTFAFRRLWIGLKTQVWSMLNTFVFIFILLAHVTLFLNIIDGDNWSHYGDLIQTAPQALLEYVAEAQADTTRVDSGF